jgi:cell filamentation protein
VTLTELTTALEAEVQLRWKLDGLCIRKISNSALVQLKRSGQGAGPNRRPTAFQVSGRPFTQCPPSLLYWSARYLPLLRLAVRNGIETETETAEDHHSRPIPAVNQPPGPHEWTDPYRDPETGVLRNLLGITDPAVLEQADADFSAVRLAQLHRRDLPGDYDLAHLRRFHRVVFGDLYPWAGELRTVSIAKGDPFCLPQHIESFAHDTFTRLAAADYLRGLDRAEFIDGVTELLDDLNALHPFRDGNGRTQRAFCAQLARHAGHQLRWTPMPDFRSS